MKRIALLAVAIALLIPSAAMAQSSSCQAYNSQLCESVTEGTTAGSDATLPFTGLDVGLLVAGGGTLLVAGFGVRRLSRRLN
jgi:hypothetical protein